MGCGRIARLVHLPLLARMHEFSIVAMAECDARSLDGARRRVPEAVAVRDYHDDRNNALIPADKNSLF